MGSELHYKLGPKQPIEWYFQPQDNPEGPKGTWRAGKKGQFIDHKIRRDDTNKIQLELQSNSVWARCWSAFYAI